MESKAQSAALVMRLVKYAFVASGILFVYIAFKVLDQPQHDASQAIQIAITVVGLWCVVNGFYLPRKIFRRTEARSQNLSEEAQVKRWKAKCIMSLAFFEAGVLYGFLLHVLGGSTLFVGLLMGAGIAAEFIWSPGPPPGAENGEFPRS
jgi:hypothetical protein